MTARHVATILLILLAALLVVGLIYARPMAAENYGVGIFNFDAVDEITVAAQAMEEDGPLELFFVLTNEDPAFGELIDAFDGRGFGRTIGSIFDGSDAGDDFVLQEGGVRWQVCFSASLAGSSLTMESLNGALYFIDFTSTEVTTSDKERFNEKITALILGLYTPEETPGKDE